MSEVGIFVSALLRVNSATIVPIFIEIWFIFDRQGAKYKLAVFLRHSVHLLSAARGLKLDRFWSTQVKNVATI